MLRIDSGLRLPGEPPVHLAAELFVPARLDPNPIVLVCLPGGGMNRHYYDLRPEDRDQSFSFAAQMSARGFLVLSLDYPGIGDSDRPSDGYALTPDAVAEAVVGATQASLDGLRSGTLVAGLPALPSLRSVGVGHSMGGLIAVLAQAMGRQHQAMVVLGFSTRGLPEYLPPSLRAVENPAAQRDRLPAWARAQFGGEPYPVIRGARDATGLFGGAQADPRAIAALKRATAPLLPVPALLAILPGNVAAEAAAIDVPVFIGVGEHDMVGPPQDAPLAFTRSRARILHVLAGAGHSHFLFPARRELFDRLAQCLHEKVETTP